jgi:hypothetical protein
MEPTQSSETLGYKIQTPGKFPEEYILQLQHGESLKTPKMLFNFMINQQMHTYKYVLSLIIIFQQHVSDTLNTISVKIIIQKVL